MNSLTPVSRPTEAARDAYNKLSRWYDFLAYASESPSTRLGLEYLDVQPGERVLEIGFGTGHALVALAQDVGTAGHVFGIDISDGMAAIAGERLAKAGLADRVGLSVGDASRRMLAPETVDAVLMSFTLELFDTAQIPVVIEHCQEMLRPGGRICVVALSKVEETLAVSLYERIHQTMPKWVDCRPIYVCQALSQACLQVTKTAIKKMWGLPVEVALAVYSG